MQQHHGLRSKAGRYGSGGEQRVATVFVLVLAVYSIIQRRRTKA